VSVALTILGVGAAFFVGFLGGYFLHIQERNVAYEELSLAEEEIERYAVEGAKARTAMRAAIQQSEEHEAAIDRYREANRRLNELGFSSQFQ
jgi:hypothetical protein